VTITTYINTKSTNNNVKRPYNVILILTIGTKKLERKLTLYSDIKLIESMHIFRRKLNTCLTMSLYLCSNTVGFIVITPSFRDVEQRQIHIGDHNSCNIYQFYLFCWWIYLWNRL